jgi:hypothetical protein
MGSSILCFSPESYEIPVLAGLLALLTFNAFPSQFTATVAQVLKAFS